MNKIKSFFKKIQPKTKYILGILGIAAIVSQGAFAFTKLSATEPRFNFLAGDRELFRGANVTENETVWKDPVSGTPGDEFQGIIYYHNGMVNTTAENTRIKVTIPAQTANKTATLTARISADNAAAVTDTIVDGQVVGLSGLTVNLTEDAELDFVPGSVRWYPNQLENPNAPVVLPGGQTGNELVTGNGVNIGGINGCWEFAGYLVFNFRTRTIEQPALNIEKTVRNVSDNQTAFVEQADANSNDRVEFKVVVENSGNSQLSAVTVKDVLPAELTYVPNTLKIDGTPTDVGQFFGTGLNTGSLAVGASKTITFEAKAPANIAAAKTVVNTATVTSGSLSDNDTASVRLCPELAPNIVLHKDAKNLTTGASAVLEGNTKVVEARPGDVIEYTLTTQNTGNATSENYEIKDGINDVLQEASFVSATNGGHVVNTGLAGNDAKQIVYPAVNIVADQTVVRKFTVKVMDPLPNNPASGFDFDHKLYNIYGDAVLVTINIPTPPPTAPILHIAKTVRNVSTNEAAFVESNTATPGDTLEYMIAFSNTGNAAADQVRFSDLLPANVSYITGTTILSMNGEAEHTLADGIIAEGVMLDTVPFGESGYIKFRVLTSKDIADGASLINTANLTDNGVTISDTAATTFLAPIVKASTPLPRTGANLLVISAIISAIFAAAGMVVISKLN
ncbi:MAG: isopeptide-forming domain-containing fimbrial protein [Patescibacteria group bacterium]